MAKKKYKSYLPKIGGTAAIAMAMAVAISAQAYAEDGEGGSAPSSSSTSSSESSGGGSFSGSSSGGGSSSEGSSGGGSSSEGGSGGGSSSESSSSGGSDSGSSSSSSSSSEGSSRSGEASGPSVASESKREAGGSETDSANKETAESNAQTVTDNNNTANENNKVESSNNAVAESNDKVVDTNLSNGYTGDVDTSDGSDNTTVGSDNANVDTTVPPGAGTPVGDADTTPALPDLPKLPDAPEFTGTEDMTDEEYNSAVDDYNNAVEGSEGDPAVEGDETDGYNDAVNDYNDAVNDYNDAANDYNQSIAPGFTGTAPDPNANPDTNGDGVVDESDKSYNDAVNDYNTAVDGYNKDLQDQYEQDLEDFDKKKEDHEDAVDQYDTWVQNNQAYQDYVSAKQTYDNLTAALKEYNDAVKAFNDLNTATCEKDAYDAAVQAVKNAQAKCEGLGYKDVENAQKEQGNLLADYDAKKAAYEKAYAEFVKEKQEIINKNNAAQNQYNNDKTAHEAEQDTLAGIVAADQAEYDALKAKYDAANTAYGAYQEALKAYEAALKQYNENPGYTEGTEAEYNQLIEDYAAAKSACAAIQDELTIYRNAIAEYEKALDGTTNDDQAVKEKYQAALNDAKSKLDAAQKALEALEETYDFDGNNADLDAGEEIDAAYTRYLELKAEVQRYLDSVENYEKELEIWEEVEDYNGDVEDYNDAVAGWNEDLEDAKEVGADVKDSIDNVGDNNAGVVVKDANGEDITDQILDTLARQDTLLAKVNEQDNIMKALATAAQQNGLGSQEYAAYLKAVEDYNDAVEAYNEGIENYNDAVAKYNAAVDTYNNTVRTESSTGSATGSTTVDWGDIRIENHKFDHIDVKYQAASSKDLVDGKLTDTLTKYTVTGVYRDEASSKNQDGTPSTDYDLSFDNDGPGTEYGTGYQELDRDNTNHEFGSNHGGSGWGNGWWGNGWWGNPGDSDSSETSDYTTPSLDPATGTVSFYVTLEDDNGKTYGLTVNLDATSVYAQGSYYKPVDDTEANLLAQYFGGKQNMIDTDGDGNKDSYDISDKSVFVISTMTCDGMTSFNSPWGLDLVLNLQTMVNEFKNDAADKISYLNYEEKAPAFAELPDDPSENPPTDLNGVPLPGKPVLPSGNVGGLVNNLPDRPDDYTRVPFDPNGEGPDLEDVPEWDREHPGDFNLKPVDPPKAPDKVEDPGDAPEDPGEFTEEAPEAPDYLVKLMERADTLDTLDKKIIKDNGGNGGSGNGGNGGNGGGHSGGGSTVIPDEDVPQVDLPDEDVPLANAPVVEVEDVEFIMDEDVPLVEWVLDAEDVTGIPQTGDSNNMMGFGSVALVALAGMFGLRKKKGN